MQSDDAVAALLNDFIEIVLCIYNPVQPNVLASSPSGPIKVTLLEWLFYL
ncbi:MAG: hypothetical protein OCD02_03670 [Spirochaetaceae bacterium]